jgi:hypothetical protein
MKIAILSIIAYAAVANALTVSNTRGFISYNFD